jgi:nicotinamidase-related amidase
MNPNRAFIAVDLVHDFIEGKFGSNRAIEVAKDSVNFLSSLNKKEKIVLTIDSHLKNDPEFEVWGEHCVKNTLGSELYQGLKDLEAYRIYKRYYDAFFQSDLEGYLKANSVKELYIFGISTDICVEHTVAGAFFRYYKINVIEDLCCSIDIKEHEQALNRMKKLYKVNIIKKNNIKVKDEE